MGPPGKPVAELDEITSTPHTDYAFFHTSKFKIVFLAICLNVVIFALDQFIITVAVPQIVSEFAALDKIEWLNTAFFIPCAATILVYSQIMTIASPRWVYMTAILIFEAGCAICGAAKSMDMLIVGRAVAGLGGAGMWNATYVIAGELIPFEKRTGWFSLFGLSYVIASVMGPVVGGALTDGSPGWRWCFYINLPIGGLTVGLLLAAMPYIPPVAPFDNKPDSHPRWLKIIRIDWIGTLLALGFVTTLGVGLQWGGITKDWSDGSVIAMLVLVPVFFISLLVWSYFMGDRAMIPLTLLRRRHFFAGIWVTFFGYGIIVCLLYYLSVFFEAIQHSSATRAGVLLLGLQLSLCPFLVITGKLGERTGQAKVFIVVGACLTAVASGLLTTLDKDTSTAKVVGFETLVGAGLGLMLNILVNLVQADYVNEPHLVPHVTGVFNFWGFIGRVIGMSVATNVFENELRKSLLTVDGLSAAALHLVASSPAAIWTAVPDNLRDPVLIVYSSSLNKVWWLTLAFAFGCLISGSLLRNLNLKELAEAASQAHTTLAYPLQMDPTSKISLEERKDEKWQK